jgi:peroxiredoxin
VERQEGRHSQRPRYSPIADLVHVGTNVKGAFTPGCQARHLPPYIQHLSELRAKGVDIVAFIATNDAFVMSAWGKVNKVAGDDIVWLSTHGRDSSSSFRSCS